ncbi:hypothetical protein E2562_009577 [Oryza meyeriana var. granulata]|uniref:Uncharacterized protein n=1 Tax=Oryza meyeriana var. granulata TaxID=110450 RepID=A0A6G1F5W7_9ORYZ|nr:hypothetical protein E2562_009577 [Oryza meyeriana var. granulata]
MILFKKNYDYTTQIQSKDREGEETAVYIPCSSSLCASLFPFSDQKESGSVARLRWTATLAGDPADWICKQHIESKKGDEGDEEKGEMTSGGGHGEGLQGSRRIDGGGRASPSMAAAAVLRGGVQSTVRHPRPPPAVVAAAVARSVPPPPVVVVVSCGTNAFGANAK